MRIYFLRHGRAVARADWRGEDDTRPLTEEGEAAMRREAARLAAMGLAPDVLVSSPLARALRTAELVAEAFGVGTAPLVDERLAPGFDAAALKEIVAEHRPPASIMLVGHEPDFSAVIGALTGGRVLCKKGGLARIDVDDTKLGGARLVWLLPPTLLARE